MVKKILSFKAFVALILSYRRVDSLETKSGITTSIPKLSTSRYDIRSQSSAISLLSVTSCLLLRPKEALANFSPSKSDSVLQSSVVPIIETIVVANDEESIFNSLVSGAATRVSKELILHPIDTVRARLQKAPDPTNPSTSDTGIKQEGLFDNLYDGLLPALVGGVPAGALFFGVKDYSKKKLRKMGLGKQESTVLSVMLTNVPYWVVRTPSEVLKTRRQIGYDNSSSVGEMIGKMVQQKGGVLQAIGSTYDSYPSNFAYAIPADIVKFVAYEALTSSVLGIKEGAKIQGLQAAVTGAAASLIAQAVTTPLDVARTRIMSRTGADGIMSGQAGANREAGKEEKINVNTSNPITELLKIAESEGASSLFSGLLPRAVRALASGGIQFASYELTQNALLNR